MSGLFFITKNMEARNEVFVKHFSYFTQLLIPAKFLPGDCLENLVVFHDLESLGKMRALSLCCECFPVTGVLYGCVWRKIWGPLSL